MSERPKTRGECVGGERPCPWVSCRHHLFLELHRVPGGENGVADAAMDAAVTKLEAMPDTCALDIADRTEMTLQEVAELFGLSRERVRQIESKAIVKLRSRRIKAVLR